MSNPLIDHIKKTVVLNDVQEQDILAHFEEISIKRKEYLITPQKICNQHFFIKKGVVRMFFITEKGVEKTIQFAIENWWITDYNAFELQANSEFYIQSLEDTTVLAIDYGTQQKLLAKHGELERYFRLIFQRAYGAALRRTKYLYDFTREDFYLHFTTAFPEFTKRVPQHILASFLNMTPEYLSEIKKNLKL